MLSFVLCVSSVSAYFGLKMSRNWENRHDFCVLAPFLKVKLILMRILYCFGRKIDLLFFLTFPLDQALFGNVWYKKGSTTFRLIRYRIQLCLQKSCMERKTPKIDFGAFLLLPEEWTKCKFFGAHHQASEVTVPGGNKFLPFWWFLTQSKRIVRSYRCFHNGNSPVWMEA